MPVLEATEVTKTFRDGRETVEVLRGMSLALEAGEVVILEGPSGSGKTTFLSILGCILAPTSGRVAINGVEVDSPAPKVAAAIRRREIGFVFQQFNLFPALSALENVQLALNIKGIRDRRARVQAEDLIEAVGLAERRHALPRDLSGGQKQRVAIARALAGDPAVLLVDEPTSNLDSEVGRRILRLFRDLAKDRNKGLLIVTHDPKAHAIADRVIEIRDGRLSVESKVGEL
jgi:putative ABC transport system ATP-binding protein